MKKNSFLPKALFGLTTAVTVTYLIWRGVSTIPKEFGTFAFIFGIIFFLMEVLGAFQSLEYFYNSYDTKKIDLEEPPLSWYPDIDVFITSFKNSEEIVRKTVNACKNMEYIDKEKVHIYICDDLDREEMKALSEKLNVGYIRNEENKFGRAGMLNFALEKSSSELVAVFDGDMIPRHNFLEECVPYFYLTKVGFVQTPKSYYNPDLFSYNLYSEKRIPDEQYHFFKDIQIAKNKTNSVIYCGTNAVISREALEDIGGFCTKTEKEDFSTGLLIQNEGYNCYAVEKTLVTGLCPTTLQELLHEKKSMLKTGIQTGKKMHIFFKKGLTLSQKLSHFSQVLYWYNSLKRFIYLLVPILYSVFGIFVIKANLFELAIFGLPMFVMNSYMLSRLSKGVRTERWNLIYETIMSPFLLPATIIEFFTIKDKSLVFNYKSEKEYSLFYAAGHFFFAVFSVIGIGFSIYQFVNLRQYMFLFMAAWLVINLYATLMAIFFVLGRVHYRAAERFKASIKCVLSWDDKEVDSVTFDISEKGFSFLTDFPYYIPYDKEIHTFFMGEQHISKFTSKIVGAGKIGHKYKYSAEIVSIEYEEKNRLYSIVYDREPSYPNVLSDGVSAINDLIVNIKGRLPKPVWYNRKLARVEINQYMKDIRGDIVFVNDFNYEFISVDGDENKQESMIIPVTEELDLQCKLEVEIKGDSSKNIPSRLVYRIQNFNEIIDNAEFTIALRNWIGINENNLQQKLAYASVNS